MAIATKKAKPCDNSGSGKEESSPKQSSERNAEEAESPLCASTVPANVASAEPVHGTPVELPKHESS